MKERIFDLILDDHCIRDVEPFIEAVQNMTEYYEQRGVDIFKEAISGKIF